MSTLSTTNIKHPSSASNNVVLDSSGNLAVQAGSASTPAIQATGDSNTGIYFSAADTVDIATGGTQRAQLDSSGNLKFNSGYGSVATAYGCRAWINFQGNGGYATRGSGNVSSFTEVGSGNGGVYNVNLTSALPDTNGAILCSKTQSQPHGDIEGVATGSYVSASQLRIVSGDWDGTYVRAPHYASTYIHVAVIR